MKQNKKINNWKIATIIIGVLTIGLLIIIMIQVNPTYKIEGRDGSIFEISKSNFDLLTAEMSYGEFRRLVDMEHNTFAIVVNMDK
jgi:hypothetical protein